MEGNTGHPVFQVNTLGPLSTTKFVVKKPVVTFAIPMFLDRIW